MLGWLMQRWELHQRAEDQTERLLVVEGDNGWEVAYGCCRDRNVSDADRAFAYWVRLIIENRLGMPPRLDTGTRYLNEEPEQSLPEHPVTPDGRYFVIKGKLWRKSNPALNEDERQRLVSQLMEARRKVGSAKRIGNEALEREARVAVDRAKRSLGERGPVWWTDGAPDYNRRLVTNTPYAEWYAKRA